MSDQEKKEFAQEQNRENPNPAEGGQQAPSGKRWRIALADPEKGELTREELKKVTGGGLYPEQYVGLHVIDDNDGHVIATFRDVDEALAFVRANGISETVLFEPDIEAIRRRAGK